MGICGRTADPLRRNRWKLICKRFPRFPPPNRRKMSLYLLGFRIPPTQRISPLLCFIFAFRLWSNKHPGQERTRPREQRKSPPGHDLLVASGGGGGGTEEWLMMIVSHFNATSGKCSRTTKRDKLRRKVSLMFARRGWRGGGGGGMVMKINYNNFGSGKEISDSAKHKCASGVIQ